MNNNKFTGIIILMTLSLMGIISVQLFWMNKAISIKEEQFNQQVNQALARASYRIEQNQNVYLMSSVLNKIANMQMFQNNILFSNKNNLEFSNFRDFWNNKTDNKHFKHSKLNNSFETVEYSFDTIIKSTYNTHHIQAYSQIIKPKDNKTINNNKNITNGIKYNSSAKHTNNIMEQMILEFKVNNIPIEERLSYSIIAPAIRHELQNLNIPLDFEYAITNYAGQPYDKLKTKNFNKNQIEKAYKTTLFPSNILTHKNKLILYFPNKRNYLTNNLLYPFLGSLIFTLIILVIFYSTLRIIYNQKKISEIKNDFINNMTHEFKTPIATISLATDAIKNTNTINNPDKVSHFANIIKDENRRMNRQVESVLKMSLIDKKDFNLIAKPTNVHQLIKQAVKNISLQIEQKNGAVEIDLSAQDDLLNIDETHFTNVIFNLLDNANKYSLNEAPKIKISSYNLNNLFLLTVTDNGIGMNKDMKDKIFEKFYRVPTGNIHTVKGFGLGLSYVKAIIMQFNGNISVKSKINSGSTFTIEIPLTSI